MPTGGLGVTVVVETDYPVNFGAGYIERFCNVGHGFRGKVAAFILNGVEDGQQRPGPRTHLRQDLGKGVGEILGYGGDSIHQCLALSVCKSIRLHNHSLTQPFDY
jgi:hypothetical protein